MNLLSKAKLAASKAATAEREGVFTQARQLWAVSVLRWRAAGSKANESWSKAREHHCSVMSMDEEEE